MFVKTRIALTFVYVIILAIILVSSGGISRYIFSAQLESRFEGAATEDQKREHLPPPNPDMDHIREDFQNTILFVNGFLLIIAAMLSYGLAGLTLRPIKRSYEQQRRFLSDASHELRTPLAILQTGLETQLRKSTRSTEQKLLQSHLEEVERMTQLVENLLTLSNFAEGDGGLTLMESFEIKPLIEKTIDRFKPLAQKGKIQINFQYPQHDDFIICGDTTLFSHAIANIISNAIAYNSKGGSVTVNLLKIDNQAVIEITDTGIGMHEDDAIQAFDRFYRVDKSRSRGTGGSGLGLSIALAIVRAHGGNILLSSNLGEGTTVTIQLPLSSIV
jgi:signal transduction histidine kinase